MENEGYLTISTIAILIITKQNFTQEAMNGNMGEWDAVQPLLRIKLDPMSPYNLLSK